MTPLHQPGRDRFIVALVFAFTTLLLAGCGGGGGGENDTASSGSASLGLVVRVDGSEVDAGDGVVRLTGTGASATITCSKTCSFASETSNGATVTNEASDSRDWTGNVALPNPTSQVHVTATPADGTSPRTIIFNRQLAASASSYWMVDSRRFDRGDSQQQLNNVTYASGEVQMRSLVIQSATSDSCTGSAHACSIVSINIPDAQPGDYAVDPNWLNAPGEDPVGARVTVKLYGFPNGANFNDDYRPASGTIRVSQGSDGVFHFETVGEIVAVHVDGANNLAGAPGSIVFRMADGY